MSNITFSRKLLAYVHQDVRRVLTRLAIDHVRPDLARADLRKAAWVWHDGADRWEFHGPDDYYWHGRAHNAYEARAKGWQAWLASLEARPS